MVDLYLAQVKLLISVLPEIARETNWALKGGTAINFFYRNLPRLSIDIDLTWLPVETRQSSLKAIDRSFNRIVDSITKSNHRVHSGLVLGGGGEHKSILVRDELAQIKIETSPVARGTVFPAERREAPRSVQEQFGFVEAKVLAFEDVYGGKLLATLDRQHPRDLYDVKILYDNEGLTDDLFRVFMVYVAGSRRPIHELLLPTSHPNPDLYEKDLAGMVYDPISYESLLEVGRRLQADIRSRLRGDIATFLLALHDTEPDFNLIGLPSAVELPAIRWKLMNLENLKKHNPKKHFEQRSAIEQLLL